MTVEGGPMDRSPSSNTSSTPTSRPSMSRGRRLAGPLFAGLCLMATLTGVIVLVILLGSVVTAVLRRPESLAERGGFFDFLGSLITQTQSISPERTGFVGGIVGSLWLLLLVQLIALPIGIGAAIFLEEYPMPGWIRRLIQTNITNLAGVPSIIYGILGLALFVRAFGVEGLSLRASVLAGGLTLSLLVLPLVIISTLEALRAVPRSLREAAMALGASRWQVIRDHVLPAALPGIATGSILAVSRAIGETAPLLMVGAAGSILFLPRSPLDRYTALPVEIYNVAKVPDPDFAFQSIAAGGIILLLTILMLMNAVAIFLRIRAGSPQGRT